MLTNLKHSCLYIYIYTDLQHRDVEETAAACDGQRAYPAYLDLLDTIIGPRQANLVLIAYASSEGSGEPAHPRSLARTFATRSYKQGIKRNLQTESQIPGPSE